MKTTLLILFSILPVTGLAQELKPRAIEPIRVSLHSDDGKPSDLEFSEQLRDQLGKFRDVAITTRRGDFEITTVTTRITIDGNLKGYACAVLVVDSRRRFRLTVETGSSLLGTAENLAAYLDREIFQSRRRK
jgi:hypothetical protein